MSTSSFGPMDLDTRPPMMARSTLIHQIQYCENCHYSNNNISSKIRGFNKVMLASKEYLDIVNKDINKTAKAFILSGQLKSNVYDYKDAGFQYLKAAWVFDDVYDYKNAKAARKKSLEYFNLYLKDNYDQNLSIMRVDIYRRSSDFKNAISLANNILSKGVEEFLEKILNFQIELCNNKDIECHTVGEIE